MITLVVRDSEHFKEALADSGVFDLYDCSVLVEASPMTPVSEIDTISKTIHWAVNVTDFKVVKAPFSEESDIVVSIAEVPIHVAENRKPKGPRS